MTKIVENYGEDLEMDLKTMIIKKRLVKLLKNTKTDDMRPFHWHKKKLKVLILAPHYDDDIISCGGIMQKHCQRHDLLDIVYFTDGSDSKASGLDKHDLISCRRMEAEKACLVIGEDINTIHLGQTDGKLEYSNDLVKILEDKIKKENYDRIYFPNPNDMHRDHLIVTTILSLVLEKMGFSCELVMYEFWNPLENPNRFFALDDFEETKLKALAKHKSQLKYANYIELVKELNYYRAENLKLKSCEAFMIVTDIELKEMICKVKKYFNLVRFISEVVF